ncbi:hypothetical protein BT96DRAFT_937197 [Gymnopus androsaceus JB14]|uniref:Zinc finger PHD-type domain-containing protein n=1 Tax=Gymnopus androsaceus JB14 TaxID=1447944 RepID=A0A6A4HWQ9_9AGAR|nr:hypothetical protein BT96DRAFT_937197 [Gymnopus androsaceus JB14]
MKHHLMNVHPTVDLVQYQHLWALSTVEVDGMQELWRNRKKSKRKKAKASTKDLPAFTVSDAQNSRLAYRTIISDNECSTEELESESDEEAVVGGTSDEDKLDNHSVAHRLVPGTNLTLAEFEFEQDGIYIDEPIDTDMIDTDKPPPQQSHLTPREQLASQCLDSSGYEPDNVESISISANSGNAIQPLASPGTATLANNTSHTVLESGLGHQSRKRKLDFTELSKCLCDCQVSEAKQNEEKVVQCKRKGCKTVWYHMGCVGLNQFIKSWTCNACKSVKH